MSSNRVAVQFRSYEWLLVAYFVYLVAVGAYLQRPLCILICLLYLGALTLVSWLDNTRQTLATSVVRDWFATASIIIAYWSLAPYAKTGWDGSFQSRWVQFDREILYTWGLQALVESAGPVIPFCLELIYLSLYVLPPFLLSLLYIDRRRERVEALYFMILAGTLVTYAWIAIMPSDPPRIAFPGMDLPHFLNPIRRFNLWIQNGSDIDTGVFPSGHVTVAFCSAFAVLRVLPERKWLARGLFVYATLLAATTIYGRYHYALDGLAGFVVSASAFCVTHLAAVARQPQLATSGFPETKRLANPSLDV